MNDDLKKLEEEAMSSIEQADTEHNLNELKALYLGKKSKLQNIMAQMKDLSIEAKKELGRKSNEFKTKVENLIEERRKKLADALINEKLKKETIDVTLQGKKIHTGYLHPLHKVVEEIEDVFIGMGYEIAEGPEVEEDLYNFEMLNLPKGHPAREMQDSFYINDTILLRTHTSPVQAHTLLEKKGQPFKIICPGKVYRRDNDDATHSHQFMQCEGLVVGENVTMADLK